MFSRRIHPIPALLILFVSLSSDTNAQVRYVPTDYPTIQAAIDAASAGDSVIVEEGTYFENIEFKGKAITVASRFVLDADTTHISRTIIDGSQAFDPDRGSVVRFVNGEDTTAALIGLTLTGGTGSILPNPYWPNMKVGGGIFVSNASPRILHNRIVENHISGSGAAAGGGIGLHASRHRPLVQYNLIAGNSVRSPEVEAMGGGISIERDGWVLDNVIRDNAAIGGFGVFGSVGGGLMAGSPAEILDMRIEGNIVSGNMATHEGGGLWIGWNASPTLIGHTVVGNHAAFGGGLAVSTDIPILRSVFARNEAHNGGAGIFVNEAYVRIINVTVVDNAVCGGTDTGPGILGVSANGSVIFNSIIRENGAGCDETFSTDVEQIGGISNVQYSNVQHGIPGEGNLDADPLLDDTYTLIAGSPSIDAGHPDPDYNDLEDPESPGSPRLPARGTLRNDQGAFGGNPAMPLRLPLQGPVFSAFVDQVLAAPYVEQQGLVDAFLAQYPETPFIEEDRIVYFLYTGNASSVVLAGDMNGWNEDLQKMVRLGGTNLFYREAFFESDARLDYKFIVNGSNWILDPRNLNEVWGGFGPNSELAMPDYVQPWEIDQYPDTPQGSLHTFEFHSDTLGNTRTIKVYTPHEYEESPQTYYPVMLFHDGLDYIRLGSVRNILDNLIAGQQIEPIIGIFVPPVDRTNEYAESKTALFEVFIVEELMPQIDADYRTIADPAFRAMTGTSYGGLITTQICYNRPEAFGLSAPISPSYWQPPVLDQVRNGAKKNVKFYLDWGTYEGSITTTSMLMRDHLVEAGYKIKWNAWHEAHSWGSWRAHLDEALIYFFPGQAATPVERSADLPSRFALHANYPNPFNPVTTIPFDLPVSTKVTLEVFDVLGHRVAVLTNGIFPAGRHEVRWNSNRMASGMYVYLIKTPHFRQSRTMLLLR